MTTATSLADHIAVHEELFAHYDALSARLTEEELAQPSLCPGWDHRTVISHTIGVDHVLQQWQPSTEEPPPFASIGAFQAELADLAPSDFAARIAETTSSRLAQMRGFDPGIADQPSITPAGIANYGRFLQVRAFDLWVHSRDISIPMGEELTSSALVAGTALQEVVDSVGYIVGKKIGLPEGMSIVFHVEGDGGRDIPVVVDGRAAVVDSVDTPDAEVTADIATFMMLAAGRIDPQEQVDSGKITWSGDPEWGERAALNLAYTR